VRWGSKKVKASFFLLLVSSQFYFFKNCYK
jgi:hypothetical protein